jgi:hopanoid C-3 methylase
MKSARVVIASGYDGGFQPIGVGTAASWLAQAGVDTTCLDAFVDGVDEARLHDADLVGISVQLFQSIAPAVDIAAAVRRTSPQARIVMFGQHANIHAERLVGRHCDAVIRGDWEAALVALARQAAGETVALPSEVQSVLDAGAPIHVNVQRKGHLPPARHALPPLDRYNSLEAAKFLDRPTVIGNVETARGCHHSCSYCSVFAATGTKVNLIPVEVVLEDIRQVVRLGATHIGFVDAEFINSRRHGLAVVRQMKAEFPDLTFDIVTRADHILESQDVIAELKYLGCSFVTSAFEFPRQRVLDAVNKGLTLEHIERAIVFCRSIGLRLNPTFIIFNPWIELADLLFFDEWLERTGIVETIDAGQYRGKLYLYKGSPLLADASIRNLRLTEHPFHYDWEHPDPRVDEICHVMRNDGPGAFKRCRC